MIFLFFDSHPRTEGCKCSVWPSKVQLCQLYWLPTNSIQALHNFLMHNPYTNQCLKYITDVLKSAAKYCLRPGRGLRSSTTNNYMLPRLQSRLGERVFSYANPLAWNKLPADLQNTVELSGTICEIPDSCTFKKSESECKCLTCNQKPTGSQFSLLHEPN